MSSSTLEHQQATDRSSATAETGVETANPSATVQGTIDSIARSMGTTFKSVAKGFPKRNHDDRFSIKLMEMEVLTLQDGGQPPWSPSDLAGKRSSPNRTQSVGMEAREISASLTLEKLLGRASVRLGGRSLIKHDRRDGNTVLIMASSTIYGLFVFILGLYLYLADIYIWMGSNMSEIFNIYLSIGGTCFLVFIIVDLRRYLAVLEEVWFRKKQRILRMVPKQHTPLGLPGLQSRGQGGQSFRIPSHQVRVLSKRLPQSSYYFTGRTSGDLTTSFFVKIGIGLCCGGHVVYETLTLGKYALRLLTTTNTNIGCADLCHQPLKVAAPAINLVHSAVALAAIYSCSNVVINKKIGLAAFGLMHNISASLCHWAHSLIVVLIAARNADSLQTGIDGPGNWTECKGGLLHFDDTCFMQMEAVCSRCIGSSSIETLLHYFQPFSVQFGILSVVAWWSVWSNIRGGLHGVDGIKLAGYIPDWMDPHISLSKRWSHAALISTQDVMASSKGLLAGAVLLTSALFGGILYMSLNDEVRKHDDGERIGATFQVLLLLLLTGASVRSYVTLSEFNVVPRTTPGGSRSASAFNSAMLAIFTLTVPSHFLLAICGSAPFVQLMAKKNARDLEHGVGQVAINLLKVLQVSVQTPLIFDGLTRQAVASDANMINRTARASSRTKGRNTIAFLLTGNLILYLWEMIMLRSTLFDVAVAINEFYGNNSVFWALVYRGSLPLTLMYRFNSAMALSVIWSSAFKVDDCGGHDEEVIEAIPFEDEDSVLDSDGE